MDTFERVYAALEGKPVDRPPVFPQIGDHAGIIAGLTYDVMYTDAETQALLEGKIGVAGNIDHIDLLPLRRPEEAEAAVHAAIKASGGAPRFMVAPGCEITSDTPVENVKAFVRAAATCQKQLNYQP